MFRYIPDNVLWNELQKLIEYRLSGKKIIFTHVILVEVEFNENNKREIENQSPSFLSFKNLTGQQ